MRKTTLNTSAGITGSVYTITLPVNASVSTISGALFSPPITSEPSSYTAMYINGSDVLDVSTIIDKCVKNGSYYDVVITPIDTQLTNVKITIY